MTVFVSSPSINQSTNHLRSLHLATAATTATEATPFLFNEAAAVYSDVPGLLTAVLTPCVLNDSDLLPRTSIASRWIYAEPLYSVCRR